MNFQGVVMNVTDLDRSIDFYCEVLGFTLLSQKEQLAAVNAPGSDRAQVLVLRASGIVPWVELATSAFDPSCWKSTRPTNRNGSPMSWRLGTCSSTDGSTANGPRWWVATRTGWPWP